MSRQTVEELLPAGLGTATESGSVSDDPFEGPGLQDAPPVARPFPVPPVPLRRVRHGCYLVNYTPNGPLVRTYDGTMRVERHSAGVTASGDLYQRPTILVPPPPIPIPGRVPPLPLPAPTPAVLLLGPPPNPALGIPIFARSRYRYYLRITQIAEGFVFGTSFTLGFELRRFNAGVWTNDGAFTALMTWAPSPAGYPSPGD